MAVYLSKMAATMVGTTFGRVTNNNSDSVTSKSKCGLYLVS